MNESVSEILELLDKNYSKDAICYLGYDENKPWQLLFATILSAQCTDERVNMVTIPLFERFQTLEDFAGANIFELEEYVRSTGFYHNKAKGLLQSAQMLLQDFDGVLPDNMEELLKLPGVGRKTANLVLSHIYNMPSITVDTHVKRISLKLGLCTSDNPDKIEFELMKILPKTSWSAFNSQLIAHGRRICKARKPACELCFLSHLCPWFIDSKY